MNRINDDGRIYLTQTRIDGALVIRFQAAPLPQQPKMWRWRLT
ncbi:hypothetical protein ACFQFQ_12805 [Sulfitobacter porphyrae]|uniref:Uncharacterized protein n=1 Tax=Sulfitobacter porphyrae TaxID=1246864 RepID=A0ABW2B3P2_9RHOB